MKLSALVFLFIGFNLAQAESPTELAQKGCIPRRDATTGNISSYDCNVAQNPNGKMEMQKLRNSKKVEMKYVSAEVGAINETMIKTCLASAYTLQKDYHISHGMYADNIQQLSWGNNDCLNKFECSITHAAKSQFIVAINSKVSKWTVDQDKRMVKVK